MEEITSLTSKKNDRSERLRIVYEYAKATVNGVKSVTSFANYIKRPQKTTDVYIKGDVVPNEGFLMAVCERIPEFNLEWLISGEGCKYNPKYLMITDENDPDYNEPEEHKLERTRSSVSGSENAGFLMYLSSLKRRISNAMKCPTKEEMDRHLNDIVEELNDSGL